MTGVRRRGLACASVLTALASVSCARYVPHPISPRAWADTYRARSLNDSALRAYLAAHGAPRTDSRWTDAQLSLVALAYRPDLARGRAAWRAALAESAVARSRPQPGLEADIERAVDGTGDGHPWVVALSALLTVELGGKRGARLAVARARTALALAELTRIGEGAIREVRLASASLDAAERRATLAANEVEALVRVQSLTRARYEEAALTATEVARGATDVAAARAELAVARGDALRARSRLARAVGVPASAMNGVQVAVSGRTLCARSDARGVDSLITIALTHRSDVAIALARYAVAEADVRSQVAARSPDLELGPGFIWDQGVNRWTLAAGLPGLLRGRSSAGVRAAQAARTESAAGVAEVQGAVIDDVGAAAAECGAATFALSAASEQLAAATAADSLAQHAYARGETSRLEPALAALAVLRARQAVAQARSAVAMAGAELAGAAGIRSASGIRWPDPRSAALETAEGF